uniref:Oberon coiled-coil region domain-containing protein n=1 Tax=Cucumis melo TaxID=3656 RepID=A0A9I9D1R4_CUCME
DQSILDIKSPLIKLRKADRRRQKLGLKEAEDRQRKKLGELKVLKNSQIDNYSMKKRMQKEISGLLERMEVTKKEIV